MSNHTQAPQTHSNRREVRQCGYARVSKDHGGASAPPGTPGVLSRCEQMLGPAVSTDVGGGRGSICTPCLPAEPRTPAPPDNQRRALTQSRWANGDRGFIFLPFTILPHPSFLSVPPRASEEGSAAFGTSGWVTRSL